MKETSHHIERRKHPRFQVQSLVFAVPSKPHMRVARIMNISKGGMAVRYVDQENWLGQTSKVDILVNSDFFMTGIPVEGISDFRTDNKSFFSITRERQCSLQFGTLSSEQECLLNEFILRYTAGNT